jgi:Big-like domain-containing protein
MKPTTVNKWLLPLIVVMCIALGAGSAWAQGQGLGSVGPLNAIGYPSFIADKAGLALEPCLDPPTTLTPVADPCAMTGTLPLGDTAPIVFVSNFPQEFFYSNVTTIIGKTGEPQPNAALDATIIMAVEGGFTAPLPPTINQQVVFFRTRLRIDGGLVAGATYKATFPFGEIVFVAEAGGKLKQVTTDIGCLAAPCGTFQQLLTAVDAAGFPINGPFLKAVDPAPPVGYVGDPNIFQTITGSPTGNNFFRIERVNGDGTLTLEGQANLFNVWGKLFTGPSPAPTLTIERTSYTKTAIATTVNVFARSVGAVAVTANVAGTDIPLRPDSVNPITGTISDRWFGQADVAAAQPGNAVNVTAVNAAGAAAPHDLTNSITLSSALVDEVTIDGVDYAAGNLTVLAHSSDINKPVMTAESAETPPVALGNLDFAGSLIVTTQAPPAFVTVVSANGGVATRETNLAPAATSIVTATALSSNINPSDFGQAVTFSANVTAAGGTLTGSVTFFDGSVQLAIVPLSATGSTALATTTTSTLTMGSHTITAVFTPADTTFKASASAIVIQVVNKGNSTTTLVLSPTTVARKASVTATATVSPTASSVGGTVTFTTVVNNATLTLGTVPVGTNGKAVLTFAAPNNRGTFIVTASYGGNATLKPSSGTAQLIIQ